MNVLLDTQIVLWVLENNSKLPKAARSVLDDLENQLYVSSISIWEIVIKSAIGKLPLPIPVTHLTRAINRAGFEQLEFQFEHAARVATLPLIHHDPFDRALLAQAFIEPMHLLTHDKTLSRYGGTVMLI